MNPLQSNSLLVNNLCWHHNIKLWKHIKLLTLNLNMCINKPRSCISVRKIFQCMLILKHQQWWVLDKDLFTVVNEHIYKTSDLQQTDSLDFKIWQFTIVKNCPGSSFYKHWLYLSETWNYLEWEMTELQVLSQDVQHADHLREDQHSVASLLQSTQQLVQ